MRARSARMVRGGPRKVQSMKIRFPTRLRKMAFGAAFAVAVGGVARAADVPWQFTGDDSRPAASVATASAALPAFVSWSFEPDAEVSGDIAFSSAPPAFVIIIR